METFSELLAEIEPIHAIDVHSYLDPASPGAASPADVILSPEIAAELSCVGAAPDAGQLAKLAPRLETIKNTAAYWRLSAVLADLFGVPYQDAGAEAGEAVEGASPETTVAAGSDPGEPSGKPEDSSDPADPAEPAKG